MRKRASNALLDLLFPPILRCGACGVELDAGSLCAGCAARLAPLRAGTAQETVVCFWHEELPRELVHRYKYGNARYLAALMAEEMAAAVRARGIKAQGVCHVPLHPRRRRERGFDQARLLAEELASRLELPFYPALSRTRNTPRQAERTRQQRLINVAGAFAPAAKFDAVQVKDKVLLLVDDVVTTGATAGECARVLRAMGAARVIPVCFTAPRVPAPEAPPQA